MGRIAKDIEKDIAAMERGEATMTESPVGDRGERPTSGGFASHRSTPGNKGAPGKRFEV